MILKYEQIKDEQVEKIRIYKENACKSHFLQNTCYFYSIEQKRGRRKKFSAYGGKFKLKGKVNNKKTT